ncbi:MAG: hypothetical protein EG828_13780, partial [Deltaproteobacteria bacterium]|nr:hypothetical protein [Deltaproteobacteria bacterium]
MKKLHRDLAAAEKTIERLRKAESRRKKDQQTLEEITYALKERVKELNCLYSISKIVEKYGSNIPMVLQATVDI